MFVNCHILPNQLISWNKFVFQISKIIIPNELGETDFSFGHSGGHIDIKRYRKSNWRTLIKQISLELISWLDFHKANDSRSFIIRNGKRKLTMDFYPQFSQYRLSLLTYSRVRFINEQITLFSSAEYTTVRDFAKRVDATEFNNNPSEYWSNRFHDACTGDSFFGEGKYSDPTFAKNSKRKIYFLAASKCINPHIDWYDIDVKSPFGGLIGVDDSRLERRFSFSKIMRMQAVLHDASGFMKRYSNGGPRYIYLLGTHSPELRKHASADISRASSTVASWKLLIVNFSNHSICDLLKTESRFKSFPNERRWISVGQFRKVCKNNRIEFLKILLRR